MKRSTALTVAEGSRSLAASVVVLDLAARLFTPGAVLALMQGHRTAALSSAVAVSGLAVVRGLAGGLLGRRIATRLWERIAEGIGTRDLIELRSRPDDQEAWRVVEAAHRIVDLWAQIGPRLVSDAIGLVVVAGLVVWRLGALWLLGGVGVLALLGFGLTPAQRALRQAGLRLWKWQTEIGANLDVLLEAPAEIRAQARDGAVRDALLKQVGGMARERQRMHTHSALVGLLPLGLALVATTGPVAMGWLERTGIELDTARLTEMGILGATGVVFTISAIRGFEAFTRAVAHRGLLDALLDDATAPARLPDSSAVLALGTVQLEEVSVTYPGASIPTPPPVTYTWEAGTSLVVTGPNGSGKTTLAHVLLGLIAPTTGLVRMDGKAVDTSHFERLRAHTVYVPQNAYVAPERTVAWHLRLAGPEELAPERMWPALKRVGLAPALERHAARQDAEPLDIPAGELSGGELRRLHLARLFVPRERAPALVVLDEPEAGLDAEGRRWLEGEVERLSQTTRVLLIAHDRTILPPTFDQLACPAEMGGDVDPSDERPPC